MNYIFHPSRVWRYTSHYSFHYGIISLGLGIPPLFSLPSSQPPAAMAGRRRPLLSPPSLPFPHLPLLQPPLRWARPDLRRRRLLCSRPPPPTPGAARPPPWWPCSRRRTVLRLPPTRGPRALSALQTPPPAPCCSLEQGPPVPPQQGQIGRASCRERV